MTLPPTRRPRINPEECCPDPAPEESPKDNRWADAVKVASPAMMMSRGTICCACDKLVAVYFWGTRPICDGCSWVFAEGCL